MKKVLAVLLVLAMSGMVWANGSQEEGSGPDEKMNFIYITPAGGHSYWVDVANGVMAAGEKYGIAVNEQGPANVDIMQQIEAIEAAIAARPDGIITMALNPSSFQGVIDEAVDAGIPVVLLDGDAPESKRDFYVGVNTYQQGLIMAEKIAVATNENAKIGIVTAGLDIDIINWRIDGMKEILRKYPGMEIVAIEDARGDSILAAEKGSAMLQTYPEINVLVAAGASDVPGVGKAIVDMEVEDSVIGVAFNDDPQGLDYLREGVFDFIIASLPYDEGFIAVEALYRVVTGEAAGYAADSVSLPSIEITGENADSYKGQVPPTVKELIDSQS